MQFEVLFSLLTFPAPWCNSCSYFSVIEEEEGELYSFKAWVILHYLLQTEVIQLSAAL